VLPVMRQQGAGHLPPRRRSCNSTVHWPRWRTGSPIRSRSSWWRCCRSRSTGCSNRPRPLGIWRRSRRPGPRRRCVARSGCARLWTRWRWRRVLVDRPGRLLREHPQGRTRLGAANRSANR